MKSITITLLFFFVFLSCHQPANDNTEEELPDIETSVDKNKIFCDTLQSVKIYEIKDLILNISDDAEVLTTQPFSDWKVRKKAVENRHTPNQIDTIFTLEKDKSFIEVYKVKEGKSILYKFQLKSSDYNLLETIEKREIEKRIESKLNCNIFTLESPEVPSYLKFIYKENRLIEVIFDGYLD